MIEQIQWLGHGSFLIRGAHTIFIDPWRIGEPNTKADFILISHDHYDHCSLPDIEKLRHAETRIISNQRVADKVADVTVIRPWQIMSFERMSIRAIPAYCPNGTQHPATDGGLGFVLSMNFYDIYYAGDTARIPEMAHIHPDIAILPINDDDTMSVEMAVEAVTQLSPRWVIPSKWGSSSDVASEIDAQDFKRRVGNIAQVIIPSMGRESLT